MLPFKIVVGLGGNINRAGVQRLAAIGADEFFIGYVPPIWSDMFGYATSPNRRCWRDASFIQCERLRDTVATAHEYGAKVSLTLNEHLYSSVSRNVVHSILHEAIDCSIDAVIITDFELLREVRRLHPDLDVHISGEAGVYNPHAVQQLAEWGASRIILPRNLKMVEIESLCAEAAKRSVEIETFAMSERCVFEGAHCFPSHGYLEKHLCNDLDNPIFVIGNEAMEVSKSLLHDNYSEYSSWKSYISPEISWLGGECGICSLLRLRQAGVGFLKIVGRGVNLESLSKRVRLVRAASLLPENGFEISCRELLDSPAFCNQKYRCYYRT